MISFLHTADLHLGMRTTRFDGATTGKIREARFTALDNILKKARELKVDFVLIAGDLFDDTTVDGLTARRAFEMLGSLPMPVFVLPGNHDPLLAGGVWDRPPWQQLGEGNLRLVREAQPIEVMSGLTLLPCPLLRKTSMDDPTAWLAQVPRATDSIRIGLAHGSLKTRDDLPLDDHLIPRHAAADLGLDYLALGHWHSRAFYADRDGVERTAYSGVHEPMRFQGSADGQSGWVPYSGGSGKEFLDTGRGEILHVRIPAAGAAPRIAAIEVGHFCWQEMARDLASREDVERLINEVATRPALERQLLKLRVTGVLDARNMLQLDELREILAHRYVLGEIDDTGLHVRPTEDEIHEAARQGVLRGVVEKLQAEADDANPAVRQIAERAMLLLYQIAREVSA